MIDGSDVDATPSPVKRRMRKFGLAVPAVHPVGRLTVATHCVWPAARTAGVNVTVPNVLLLLLTTKLPPNVELSIEGVTGPV
jgi:hypothetical protein